MHQTECCQRNSWHIWQDRTDRNNLIQWLMCLILNLLYPMVNEMVVVRTVKRLCSLMMPGHQIQSHTATYVACITKSGGHIPFEYSCHVSWFPINNICRFIASPDLTPDTMVRTAWFLASLHYLVYLLPHKPQSDCHTCIMMQQHKRFCFQTQLQHCI